MMNRPGAAVARESELFTAWRASLGAQASPELASTIGRAIPKEHGQHGGTQTVAGSIGDHQHDPTGIQANHVVEISPNRLTGAIQGVNAEARSVGSFLRQKRPLDQCRPAQICLNRSRPAPPTGGKPLRAA